MPGRANLSAENFSGTFTINWPAGSGFNPSNGNLTVTESNGLENVSGSVTSEPAPPPGLPRNGKARAFFWIPAKSVVGARNPGCLACWPWQPLGCSEREGC
jgi:hypothetical protein